MLGKLDFFIIGYAAGTVVTLLLIWGAACAYDRRPPAWHALGGKKK